MAYYKQDKAVLCFNPASPTVMHIDLNSCFASIEQQANPFLRGKPVAVAAYDTPNGCILAASYEAKRWGVGGIETGMRVKDAKKLCSSLIVLKPDPWKYRNVHLALRNILKDYTNDFVPKSIDEFVLNLKGTLHLHEKRINVNSVFSDQLSDSGLSDFGYQRNNLKPDNLTTDNRSLKTGVPFKICASNLGTTVMQRLGLEIKQRIKNEIGDWLTVSIGIAPNRFLAKTASNLIKPDGLSTITKENYEEVFKSLALTKLCGIKERNATRLRSMGVADVWDFYNAELWRLRAAFHSVTSYYWYTRLHGWEVDDVTFGRRSYGNSYSIPQPLSTEEELAPILAKLVTKMSSRLRRAGYCARGVHLAIQYRNGAFWHKGRTFPRVLFETSDIYKEAMKIMSLSPYHFPVRNLAVSCFDLLEKGNLQLELFSDVTKKEERAQAMDSVNNMYGEYVLMPARMIDTGHYIPDRIAFGNVKELEEFTVQTMFT